MARPFNNEVTKKSDRIIAKIYEQFYRWGFSSKDFEELIAKAAYRKLRRAKTQYIGNADFSDEDDMLSTSSIEKIYKNWKKENNPYFKRIIYSKKFICDTAPKKDNLYEVISFFMEYMNQEPEKCIFKSPPECTDEMIRNGNWWRFHDGALDGDPVLNKKAIENLQAYPKINKGTGKWWED